MKNFLILSAKIFAFLFVMYFVVGILNAWFPGDTVARTLYLFTTKINVAHITLFSLLFSIFWVMISARK